MPASNAPHNNNGGTASNVDQSLERGPGGTLGNDFDTGNNAADFTPLTPANPQNLSSSPTPP
jgi:hypothetical protein